MLNKATYNELVQVAKNFIPAEEVDDVIQEVFLHLYEDKQRLAQLIADKKLKFYFIRLCKNNYYSKTSKYYYKYKRPYKEISFNTDYMNLGIKQTKADELYFIEDADTIHKILDELYWYEKELFKLYVLGDNNGRRYTYTSLSKKTKISRISIYTTIKNVKVYIKKRLQEIKNDL